MGCSFSRENGCYSVTCCCCLDVDEACSWIAAVGLTWGGVATMVDFISANLPEQRCRGCIDHDLNAQLSQISGCINVVQWLASVLLLIGGKLENRWLLLPWLAWGVVSLAMQGVWVIFTAPYMPSVRPSASLFQLGWGIHFFLVVKTQYTRLALTFTLPEEVPLIVPPNTPVRRHKRRWRRLHPACQPPIRTLVGVGLRLQRILQYSKRVKEFMNEEGEKQEENEKEEEEEEEEIRIIVGSDGDIDTRRDEETSVRRRSGWKAYGGWEANGDSREQDVCEVIIHTSNRDVSGRMEEKGLDGDNVKNDHKEKKHEDEKDVGKVEDDVKKADDECGMEEMDEEDEEKGKTQKKGCKKGANEEEEEEEEARTGKEEYNKDADENGKKGEDEAKEREVQQKDEEEEEEGEVRTRKGEYDKDADEDSKEENDEAKEEEGAEEKPKEEYKNTNENKKTLKLEYKKDTNENEEKPKDESKNTNEESKDSGTKDTAEDEKRTPKDEYTRDADEGDRDKHKNRDEEEKFKHKKNEDKDEERKSTRDENKKEKGEEDETHSNEGDGGGQCEAIQRDHGEPITVLWRA